MQRRTRPKPLLLPPFVVYSGHRERPWLIPTLPQLDMGDPFSAENIALFELQADSVTRPQQAHLPHQQALSDVPEESTPEDMPPNVREDIESQEKPMPSGTLESIDNKKGSKPFEFVIT